MHWIRTIAKLLVVAAVISVPIYWLRFRPIPVSSHEVQQGLVVDEVMGTGTLEARLSATISPKISGRIEAMLADQGDSVDAGQKLVQLDDAELQQQVEIAKANVDAALAAIERLKADKERALVVLKQAESNFNRIKELSVSVATSKTELDQAAEKLGVSIADVSRAEAGINEGQKALVAAEKNLQYQEARLSDTVIVAPFDGMVIRRRREAGDVVVPGSSVMTLISTQELWISAWVDETQMSKLETALPARVIFRSEPSKSYSGQVARIGREADRETREFIVDVRVIELPKNWAIGQRAEVYIQVEPPAKAVRIPKPFLFSKEGAQGVFVLRDGKATWRPISVGVDDRDAVAANTGVEAGEVILKPASTNTPLQDDRRVAIQ